VLKLFEHLHFNLESRAAEVLPLVAPS